MGGQRPFITKPTAYHLLQYSTSMPLFRNTWDNQPIREPATPPPSPPTKRTGLFSSRRSLDDPPTHRNYNHTDGNIRRSPTSSFSGGFFSRRRSSDELSDHSSRRSGRSGRSGKPESSIVAARQKIADAENAERLASDALRQARNAAREAKEHIRMLEDEALEE